jgi:SAM-dependent methyltransferase
MEVALDAAAAGPGCRRPGAADLIPEAGRHRRNGMDNQDGYVDERAAARYDEQSADMFEPAAVDPVVEVLATLAGGGRALELGIGTGRIALPLARRGVPVHGIELSRAMAARLRAKPGGEAVGVTIGDFATAKVDGTFSVAYLVFNTIMNLTTQEAQVACFRNVATHLEPGGCFVIEVRVPELRSRSAMCGRPSST